jgi:hypothetical protein
MQLITEIIIFTLTTYIVIPTFFESLMHDTYDLSTLNNIPTILQTINQNTSDFRLTYLAAVSYLILLYVFLKSFDTLVPSLLKNRILSSMLIILLLLNLMVTFFLIYTIVTNFQPLFDKQIYSYICISALINYHTPEYCIRLITFSFILYAIISFIKKLKLPKFPSEALPKLHSALKVMNYNFKVKKYFKQHRK